MAHHAGDGAGQPRAYRWRAAPVAAVAVAAAGVLAGGLYVAMQPAGGTSRAALALRAQPSVPPRIPARHPARLEIGTLGSYHVARRYFTVTRLAGAAGSRRLRVTLRYPVVANIAAYRGGGHGIFPLVIFAPGFRHCASVYGDLLRQWSSAGYVVAAVDFPRTSCASAAPDEADVTHQPADVAFVIERLLARSAERHGPLAGLIAADEIAVAGHSDGGDTAAALAGAPCCRDRRVRAAVILSGAQWPAFGGRWFQRAAPPLLVSQGTADPWNPPADSVQLYQSDLTGPRYYLDLPGADHFTPYQGHGSPEPIVARVTMDFLDRYLLGQWRRAGAMWHAGKVAGKALLAAGGRLPR